jgi:hypothetical protein
MLIFGEMQHGKPICRVAPKRGMQFRMALAGLVAANLLLVPALAADVAQSAKPGHASRVVVLSATPQSNTQPRVSPYAIANKQRAAESNARHFPALQLPVRRAN